MASTGLAAPLLSPGRERSPSSRTIPWDRVILGVAGALIAYLVLAPLAMLVFSSIKSTASRLPIGPARIHPSG